MPYVFDLDAVACRFLGADGLPDPSRAPFHAVLQHGLDTRLVDVPEPVHLPRDVLRAYARGGHDRLEEVRDALESDAYGFRIGGVSWTDVPKDVLDGVGPFAVPVPGDPKAPITVDVVACETRAGKTVHGLRVTGPDFDAFGAFPLSEIVGLTPVATVEAARGMTDESSHVVTVAMDAAAKVVVGGKAYDWYDDLEAAIWRP